MTVVILEVGWLNIQQIAKGEDMSKIVALIFVAAFLVGFVEMGPPDPPPFWPAYSHEWDWVWIQEVDYREGGRLVIKGAKPGPCYEVLWDEWPDNTVMLRSEFMGFDECWYGGYYMGWPSAEYPPPHPADFDWLIPQVAEPFRLDITREMPRTVCSDYYNAANCVDPWDTSLDKILFIPLLMSDD